jgi:hypothetical protein
MAQSIIIDSTFTTDAEIFPFNPNDTIFGLGLSGNLILNSDTSLVRVIVGDSDSLEFMVLESYPLICNDNTITLNKFSDETTFLNTFKPKYIRLALVNASM